MVLLQKTFDWGGEQLGTYIVESVGQPDGEPKVEQPSTGGSGQQTRLTTSSSSRHDKRKEWQDLLIITMSK